MTALAFAFNFASHHEAVSRESQVSSFNGLFLERVQRRLAHHGNGDNQRFQRSGFVAAGFNSDPAAGRSESSGPIVWANNTFFIFHGRLDNRKELKRELPATNRLSDAQLAFRVFLKHGESFLQRLAGPFALAVIEPEKRSVLLARDVVGTRPLYFYLGQDLLVVASEAVGVLAYPGVPAYSG